MALPTKTEVLQGNYNELGSAWSNIVLHSDIAITTNANADGSAWWGAKEADGGGTSLTYSIDDAITLSDSLVKSIAKIFADAISLSDNAALQSIYIQSIS